MTIQRPDLTPAELQDARDAWMLVQLGQPVPTMYRPGAMKAAAYCFARGYDHDDAAGARPVFIHPDGGKEGHPGVYGVNRTWTPTQVAAWIARKAGGMRAKGTGPMFSPGHSWRGDDHAGDGEVFVGAYPMAHLQRGDERCRAIGWLFLDADDVGEWVPVISAIGLHGGAYVRGRSGSHCPAGRGCELHPKGQTKWHLAVPLRETWSPPTNPNAARAEWKGELYAAARFSFHLVAEVTGRGFDRQLDQFLCRMYVGAPYDPKHFGVPREIHGQEGLGFDVRACWAGLEELGVVDPVQVHASRVAATLPPGTTWDEADGEPPMVAAFKVAGFYVRPMASGKHLVACPWESMHTSGKTGDSSAILWPNGKFLCSHSHAEGKAAGGAGMREVLAMLPAEAQAAHAQARAAARARERSTSARRETALNQDDSEGSAMDAAEPTATAGEEGAATELAMLLGQLEADVLNATGALFIKRASQLPRREFAQLHDALKRAKVPLREFNAAVAERRKEREQAEARSENEARIANLTRHKPQILLSPEEDRVADEAVIAVGKHPDIYQRAGQLVNVRRDLSPAAGVTRPKDAPRISPLPTPTLREYLSACAVWIHMDPNEGPQRVHVPQSAVLAVHARGQWDGVRTLESVIECPMLRPDGTVITRPGFDPATGLLYVPNDKFPPVPEHPTREQVEAALALLFDVVADFPFKTRAHRSAWLAALLTCLARPAFLGCSPLNMIDGNTAGAGKGKLVNVIGLIVGGRDIATMAPVEDDAEQRKRITSMALTGEPMVLIDNVAGTLGGPSLDSALTSTSWGDRLLGGNVSVKLPLSITWFATGNNIQMRGDLIRRVLHIRLETPHDRPEERKQEEFRHPELESYIRANRGVLAVAALTILRGYCAAGRPRQSLASWGSFEGWTALIRETVVWAGEPDPADTRVQLRDENDVSGQAHADLVDGWRQVARRFGGSCTAREALQELARNETNANSMNGNEALQYDALRAALGELIRVTPGKQPTPTQLGYVLRSFRAKPAICADGQRWALLQPKGDVKNAARWTAKAVEVQASAGGMTGDDGGSDEPSSTRSEAEGRGGWQGIGGDAANLHARENAKYVYANTHVHPCSGLGDPPLTPVIPPGDGVDMGPQWSEGLDP